MCCILTADEAKLADCPPGFHLGSPVCDDNARNQRNQRCLQDTPAGQPTPNVLGVSCHLLASETPNVRDQYIRKNERSLPV